MVFHKLAHLLKPWMMICLMYILVVERSAAQFTWVCTYYPQSNLQ